MTRNRWLVFSGFVLEQFACALGVLALFCVAEPAVGVALTISVGAMTLLGLFLVTIGAIRYHRHWKARVGRK